MKEVIQYRFGMSLVAVIHVWSSYHVEMKQLVGWFISIANERLGRTHFIFKYSIIHQTLTNDVDSTDAFIKSLCFGHGFVKVMIADADWSIFNNGNGMLRKNNFWTGHGGVGNILFTDGHIEGAEFDPTGIGEKSLKHVWSYYYDNAW